MILADEISPYTTLLTLKDKLTFSNCLVPICTWLDVDKIPFHLQDFPELEAVVPYHQPKCKEVINSTVSPVDFGCAVQYYTQNCTVFPQEPLVAFRNESNLIVPYLVGFPTPEAHCDGEDYATRSFFFEKFSSIVEKTLKMMK